MKRNNLQGQVVALEAEKLHLENEIERLQEENLLLKASEPMSKLAEDYGYKAETERLNNIIKRFEEDLKEMYLTFGEFSEEYTENRIKELKGSESNEHI